MPLRLDIRGEAAHKYLPLAKSRLKKLKEKLARSGRKWMSESTMVCEGTRMFIQAGTIDIIRIVSGVSLIPELLTNKPNLHDFSFSNEIYFGIGSLHWRHVSTLNGDDSYYGNFRMQTVAQGGNVQLVGNLPYLGNHLTFDSLEVTDDAAVGDDYWFLAEDTDEANAALLAGTFVPSEERIHRFLQSYGLAFGESGLLRGDDLGGYRERRYLHDILGYASRSRLWKNWLDEEILLRIPRPAGTSTYFEPFVYCYLGDTLCCAELVLDGEGRVADVTLLLNLEELEDGVKPTPLQFPPEDCPPEEVNEWTPEAIFRYQDVGLNIYARVSVRAMLQVPVQPYLHNDTEVPLRDLSGVASTFDARSGIGSALGVSQNDVAGGDYSLEPSNFIEYGYWAGSGGSWEITLIIREDLCTFGPTVYDKIFYDFVPNTCAYWRPRSVNFIMGLLHNFQGAYEDFNGFELKHFTATHHTHEKYRTTLQEGVSLRHGVTKYNNESIEADYDRPFWSTRDWDAPAEAGANGSSTITGVVRYAQVSLNGGSINQQLYSGSSRTGVDKYCRRSLSGPWGTGNVFVRDERMSTAGGETYWLGEGDPVDSPGNNIQPSLGSCGVYAELGEVGDPGVGQIYSEYPHATYRLSWGWSSVKYNYIVNPCFFGDSADLRVSDTVLNSYLTVNRTHYAPPGGWLGELSVPILAETAYTQGDAVNVYIYWPNANGSDWGFCQFYYPDRFDAQNAWGGLAFSLSLGNQAAADANRATLRSLRQVIFNNFASDDLMDLLFPGERAVGIDFPYETVGATYWINQTWQL